MTITLKNLTENTDINLNNFIVNDERLYWSDINNVWTNYDDINLTDEELNNMTVVNILPDHSQLVAVLK